MLLLFSGRLTRVTNPELFSPCFCFQYLVIVPMLTLYEYYLYMWGSFVSFLDHKKAMAKTRIVRPEESKSVLTSFSNLIKLHTNQ